MSANIASGRLTKASPAASIVLSAMNALKQTAARGCVPSRLIQKIQMDPVNLAHSVRRKALTHARKSPAMLL